MITKQNIYMSMEMRAIKKTKNLCRINAQNVKYVKKYRGKITFSMMH